MSFLKNLKSRFAGRQEHKSPSDGDSAQQVKGPLDVLTQREREVFRLLVEGYTIKETAQSLGIKYSTANTHMTGIYKKLGVNSRAELIIRYRDFEKENEL